MTPTLGPDSMKLALSRRDVIRQAALLAGGGCLCHLPCGAAPPRSTHSSTPALEPGSLTIENHRLSIELAKAPSLSAVGNAARISSSEPLLNLIVVRAGKRRYVVLSGQCTHAGRPLSYLRSREVLQCNNFGHATFDLAGQVLKGPAEQPLKTYAVALREGKLEVAL